MQDSEYAYAEGLQLPSPRFATFTCQNYRDATQTLTETGIEPDESSQTRDGCESPFAELLLPLWEELLPCPHCGGPSVLLELLTPAVG